MKDKVLQRINFKEKLRHKHIMEEAKLYHRLEIEKIKQEQKFELKRMSKEAQLLIINREIYAIINKTFKLPIDYKDWAKFDSEVVGEVFRKVKDSFYFERKKNIDKFFVKKIKKDDDKDTL